MRLLLLAPRAAHRSCDDCQTWLYDDRGGNFGERLLRGGMPIPRAKGSRTPCAFCPKIPPGQPAVPTSAVELDEAGYQCWDHYRACKGVNWQVPEAADPIVRRNAGLIRAVEEAVERASQQRTALTVLGSLGRA